MAGRGSLAGMMPYGDANAIVMDMAREVLPVVSHTPVLAGVCGTDPFRVMKLFLREVDRAGFSGVQNFPTVGLIDGTFRANLEETGMGFGLEVDMIRAGPRVGPADDALRVQSRRSRGDGRGRRRHSDSAHGSDDQGNDRRPHGADARRIGRRACRPCTTRPDACNRDILVLCHGGPIAEPADAQYILDHTEGIVGFYGASSMERLPVEPAITDRVREFTQLKFKPAK